MGTATNTLKEAEVIFLSLLTLGLIGLLFLIVYGNLSGNLGFADQTLITVNETSRTVGLGAFINQTGYTLIRADDNNFTGGATITVIFNTSDHGVDGGYNFTIPAANYTVDSVTGILTTPLVASRNYTNVSVSYTTAHTSVGERDTTNVITNLTSGATQFFTFSNVWFILTAVTVLIGIVLGVIVLVKQVSGGGKGKGDSRFTT